MSMDLPNVIFTETKAEVNFTIYSPKSSHSN